MGSKMKFMNEILWSAEFLGYSLTGVEVVFYDWSGKSLKMTAHIRVEGGGIYSLTKCVNESEIYFLGGGFVDNSLTYVMQEMAVMLNIEVTA